MWETSPHLFLLDAGTVTSVMALAFYFIHSLLTISKSAAILKVKKGVADSGQPSHALRYDRRAYEVARRSFLFTD